MDIEYLYPAASLVKRYKSSTNCLKTIYTMSIAFARGHDVVSTSAQWMAVKNNLPRLLKGTTLGIYLRLGGREQPYALSLLRVYEVFQVLLEIHTDTIVQGTNLLFDSTGIPDFLKGSYWRKLLKVTFDACFDEVVFCSIMQEISCIILQKMARMV